MTYPATDSCQKCAGPEGSSRLAAVVNDDVAWEHVLAAVPVDLEASARETGALRRRRVVRSAANLLRLVLAYTLVDWSFRLVGGWATARALGSLSDVAVRQRVRGTLAWLQVLIGACLAAVPAEVPRGTVRVRLVDATTAQRPGSPGTDWRLHLRFDLGKATMIGIDVTDAHGGETLTRHPAVPNEITVGDRGYAHRRGIEAIVAEGGEIVVRCNWQNLPLQGDDGEIIDLIGWLRQVPATGTADRPAQVVTPTRTVAVRLIARRLSQEAADAARRRIRQEARKHGRTPDQRTLEAAGFIILVTTLAAPTWSAEQVLALYRFRWQIELVFKRLKGVLHLAGLRMHDAELAQVYLHGKILAALLIEREQQREPLLRTEWLAAVDRPISPWRCLAWYAEALRDAVRGSLDWDALHVALPRLARYLRDAPRQRVQQAAQARSFLATHACSPAHSDPTLSLACSLC